MKKIIFFLHLSYQQKTQAMLHSKTSGFFKAIGTLIFSFLLISESVAQARLDFVTGNSPINSFSFSEVQSPVTDPPCPPAENISSNGIPFTPGFVPNKIWGGAHTLIKRGRPNCKVSASGTGNVSIEGAGSNSVKVQWWCHSIGQYDCYDPDCAWFATDTSSVNATVQLQIAGVTPGVPVSVTYYWIHFSSAACRSEAVSEDYAEIQNASLNLFGQMGFGAGMNLSVNNLRFAQLRTGDTTVTYTAFNGDTLNIDVTALTAAHIEPPAYLPPLEREDDASADFFGYVIIVVNAPGSPVVSIPTQQCPNSEMYYSVDIGGDTELSDPTVDGNEILDPGDLYAASATAPVPFFNDSVIFNADPNPSVGNPAGTCNPVPASHEVINFDLDGADRIDYDLFSNSSNYGAGKPSIAAFNSDCVYTPEYMLLSYDEDRGIHFSSVIFCDVPSVIGHTTATDSTFVKGTISGNDEILAGNLTNISGTPQYYGSIMPFMDEQSFSALIAPSPLSLFPPDVNDDVDALDRIEDVSLCDYQYFSVDHEAHYIHGVDTLRPGFIYQYTGSGTIQAVIHPVLHLGLPNEIDIDAFEFAFVYDSSQQRNGLALVFSVAAADPLGFDYSGGLDPGALYGSFLNGSYFELLPPPVTGNIDALTFFCGPISGFGATYIPPVVIVGMDEEEMNDINLQLYPNPNSGSFNIEFSLKEKAQVNIAVMDMNGKSVWANNNLNLPAGSRKITVPMNEVSNGLYFVEMQITSGNNVNTIRRKISVMR
jgi:hypothetical protein